MDIDENEKDEAFMFKDSHRFRFGKLLKTIFKCIAILIIVLVYGTIFVRLFFLKVPSDFKGFTWTDNTMNAYNADPDGFKVLTQDSAEDQDANGYFQISNIAFSRDAGEIQFTIRYNSRNTINVLKDSYGLAERPTGESFIYILRDGSGNIYKSYEFAAASRPMNEFRRIIFDDVNFVDVDTLYVDIYYGSDVSEDGLMNATFTVYDTSRSIYPLDAGTPSDPNFTLSQNPAYISKLDD